MKKSVIYLRGRRVSSTATFGFLFNLRHMNLIDFWSTNLHCPVTKTRRLLANYWNKSKKCITIRNPYENNVSIFLHHKEIHYDPKNRNCLSNDFIKKQSALFRDRIKREYEDLTTRSHKKANQPSNLWYADRQWSIYADGDTVLADIILRYEDPKNSFINMARELNIDLNFPMKNKMTVLDKIKEFVNRSKKITNKYDYRDFYDDETKKLAYQMRKKEIDYFNYKF